MGSRKTTLAERMAALAMRHVEAEDRSDIEGTLATFQDDATFELFPCGLRLAGLDRIRRYYDYFFTVSRQFCVGYMSHGTFAGDSGFGNEMTVTMRYPDGAERDFRVFTVFRYGETALRGERIYADSEFFRLIFGPLLAETEPLAP